MILILENDFYKAKKALEEIWETNRVVTVFVCRLQTEAQAVITEIQALCKFGLILDGELDPGCGSGKQFLDWMIAKHCDKIDYVQPNSSSPFVNKEMVDMCKEALVPVGYNAHVGR